MTRILTYIRYELKIFLGSPSNMFWMIAFPLLLLTVFSIAFSNLRFRELNLEKASIAYDEEAFMSLYFVEAPKEMPNFATLDRSSIENSLFKGQAMTKDQALEALQEGQIEAYVDKDLDLVISKNGINQMIMDEVLTSTKQIASLNLPLTAYEFNRTTLRTVTKSPAQLMSSSIHSCDDHSLWRLSIKRDRQSIDREGSIRFTTKHYVIDAPKPGK